MLKNKDMTNINEIWLPIKDAPEYMVSNNGGIFSKKSGRNLKPTKEHSGYLAVSICIKGIYKRKRLHQWVAGAFLANPNSYPQINHIDCNKSNNNVSNLEWCTSKQNINHAFDNGLVGRKRGELSHMYGAKNPYSKKVVDTSNGKVFDTIKEAAEYVCMPRTTLNAALTGKRPNNTSLVYESVGIRGITLWESVVGEKVQKIVLNKETGVYFGCISEAAKAHDLSRTHLNSMLNGKRKNKTSFTYA